MTKKQKRDQVILIVLSVIDLTVGILSIIFTALSVQILAALASGATLFKAVKIAIQATKASKVAKEIKPKIITLAILKIFTAATRVYNKYYKKGGHTSMKKFFTNVATKIKNNPITLITIILEALCIGAAGGGAIYLNYFNFLPKPWDLVIGIACTVVLYAIFVVLTIYLGYDNEIFAKIRQIIKSLGGKNTDAIMTAIDAANESVKKELELEAAKEAELKAAEEKRKNDEKIWAMIQKEEAEKKKAAEKAAEDAAKKAAEAREEAIKQAKIAEYKASHPDIK